MTDTSKKLPVKSQKHEGEAFKGYTMEELKYQRAMMALRVEFCKQNLINSIEALRPAKKESDKHSLLGPKFAFAKSIASKVFSNLNLLDYAMIGMSLFGTAKNAYNLFKRKK